MLLETLNKSNRDERQEECIRKWISYKGKATIVAGTGFGKTRVAIKTIQLLRKKYPTLSVLVTVPTELLKNQWVEEIDKFGLGFNTEVRVMMGLSKENYVCDLLIIDEAHRISSEVLSNILTNTKFKLILGLTATFERLDGRHEILAKYAPVCDTITLHEALLNGWVSNYKDYVVLLDVPDIDVYKGYNKEFIQHFEYFQFDWNLVMSMIGPKGFINRAKYRDEICKDESKRREVFKEITYHAMGFMRALQNRKKFIYNHPEKIRIANEIIAMRPNNKIITFSANVKMAESIQGGLVYTGKEGKKKNRITLEEFSKMPSGVLSSCKLAEEGFNLPDLSVGIMLGVNSSKTKAIQTLGRVIRKTTSNKEAEFFTIIINDTVESEWLKKSRVDNNFIVIDEENLLKVLKGEPFEPYKRKLQNFTYRF